MRQKSEALAAHQCARLIYQLRKSIVPKAVALADILAACSQTSRCRSAACPICGSAFQQVAADAVGVFVDIPARSVRGRITAITIIPNTGCVRPEAFSLEIFERVGAQICVALTTAGLPAAIIGLEASFNEDRTESVQPHWCVHGHGFLCDWLAVDQVKALRKSFPRSQLIKRPVMCVPLDQKRTGRIYPFKPERFRRETVWNTSNPKRGPYRDTKSRDLRPWQAVDLAVAEHELGFGGRVLIHAIDEMIVWDHFDALGWQRNPSKLIK